MIDLDTATLDTLGRTAIDTPRAYGPACARATFRAVPEDFVVVEKLGFEPDGDGEHWLVEVRKTGWNTDAVAGRLAAFAAVSPREVSYAGLKDRHAVTTQWFSIRQPRGSQDWPEALDEGIEIVSAARHRRRLRRGAHTGNMFRIRLRNLTGEREALDERMRRIATHGVPNYFGEQRFGRGGANLERANDLLFEGRRERSRQRRGLYLSAARSALFNAVLARRVDDGSWCRLLAGDELMLEGTHSRFATAAIEATLQARAQALDVHPTGPLWGRGQRRIVADALAEEDAALAPWQRWCVALAEAGLEQDRRALRMRVQDLGWAYEGDDALVVCFALGRGQYATSVLRELAAVSVVDASP